MNRSIGGLRATQAATRLGVSAKALRLYERHGLIAPGRTQAGWRVYMPEDIARVRDVLGLKTLGLELAQIKRIVDGDDAAGDTVLADQECRLRTNALHVSAAIKRLRDLRSARREPTWTQPATIVLALPWPWDGETITVAGPAALTYITGPLGSGKTRLAMRLADTVVDAGFLGLDRFADDASWRSSLRTDETLAERVSRVMGRLVSAGAVASDALKALIVALEQSAPTVLVVDMVEEGLDDASQKAFAAHLREHGSRKKSLFLMTRSSTILDLALLRGGERILYCPANHGPPLDLAGYGSDEDRAILASCLATPVVRARTTGMMAVMDHHL